MRLSLIGMSGSGKSSWTQKLVEIGFRGFHCDDRIEEILASELMQPDGTRMDVGEWMGFPYDPDYRYRESKYLSLEKAVLAEILIDIDKQREDPGGNLVIDTTGSVIYAGNKLLRDLRRLTTVVHLETPSHIQEAMLVAYLKNRRPVLWRDLFNKKTDETNDIALARCYATLLNSREKLYKRWADVTIDYAAHSKSDLQSGCFLEMVSAQFER